MLGKGKSDDCRHKKETFKTKKFGSRNGGEGREGRNGRRSQVSADINKPSLGALQHPGQGDCYPRPR